MQVRVARHCVSVDTARSCVSVRSARVTAEATPGVLECLRALTAANAVVCGANAVAKQLATGALAVIVLATQGIAPPLLNRHLEEAAAVARCPVCALEGLTSDALGVAVGLKRALSVGVRSTADALLLMPILCMAVVPSLPWLQNVPGMCLPIVRSFVSKCETLMQPSTPVPTYEALRVAVTQSRASEAVRLKRQARKGDWQAKQKLLLAKKKQDKDRSKAGKQPERPQPRKK